MKYTIIDRGEGEIPRWKVVPDFPDDVHWLFASKPEAEFFIEHMLSEGETEH